MPTKLFPRIALASCCVFIALSSGIATAETNTQTARLQQLATDFHGAFTLGDYDLMLSLWAEDAVYSNPAGVVLVGPTAIADFFAANPGWGRQVSLAPNYKTKFRVYGNIAYYEFECIIVDVGDLDPLDTSLSTLPPGAQNPLVKIVAHLATSGIAVKRDEAWVFQTFVGSGGPLKP